MSMKLSRRSLLSRTSIVAAGVIASPAILHRPAYAAEFTYKCGTALPDGHPMVIRGREAAGKIKEESSGRLDITFYTNSVLGQDTSMISQTIAGALEMYCLPIDLLAPKNQACGIFGVGFAFDGYTHAWEAMDGDLGNYLRDLAKGIGFHCIEKTPDHGFRQITMKAKPIKSPDDLKGIKIRLPVAPYLIALFQALGASPTPINFGEVYSALQTGLVDGIR
jgi:TRAP-type transport system periplasmic protein